MSKKKIHAIILARGGSKGIKRKNLFLINFLHLKKLIIIFFFEAEHLFKKNFNKIYKKKYK